MFELIFNNLTFTFNLISRYPNNKLGTNVIFKRYSKDKLFITNQ